MYNRDVYLFIKLQSIFLRFFLSKFIHTSFTNTRLYTATNQL